MSQALTTTTQNTAMSVFGNSDGFELAQRMAKMLASSQLVPAAFQGKIADCVIALEMAARIGASPMAVLQNMYIVHGKPAWSSQFLIACLNASGNFSPIRFRLDGEGDDYGAVAWAKDKADGEILEGPRVTIGMAKAEGWYTKNGSKWVTMPELMLRYRAATFFARLYAPEITMGIMTDNEVIDITPIVTEHPALSVIQSSPAADLAAKFRPPADPEPEQQPEPEPEKVSHTQAEIAAALGVPPTLLRDYCTAQGWTRGSFQGVDNERRQWLMDNAETAKMDIGAWFDNQSK